MNLAHDLVRKSWVNDLVAVAENLRSVILIQLLFFRHLVFIIFNGGSAKLRRTSIIISIVYLCFYYMCNNNLANWFLLSFHHTYGCLG